MEFLLPLVSFAFVTSITPGPNNMLLLASGLRFGFLRTLPHIAGIQAGVALQLFFSAMGLSYIIMQVPAFNTVLKLIGTAYLLYLAWVLKNASFNDSERENARPFTFFQALLFQFINPKAWLMTLTAGALFLPNLSSNIPAALLLCVIFSSVGTPSSGSWALAGGVIRQYLNDGFWQGVFSIFMISLTVFTAIYIWIM